MSNGIPVEIEEYGHGFIVTDDPWHYFETPLQGEIGPMSKNPKKARLYGDVYEVVGGLTEKKTGERGIPPSVARAGGEVFIAYMVAQLEMNIRSVAHRYDLSEEEVRDQVRAVRERAEESRRNDMMKEQIRDHVRAVRELQKEEQRSMEAADE